MAAICQGSSDLIRQIYDIFNVAISNEPNVSVFEVKRYYHGNLKIVSTSSLIVERK